VCVVCAVHMVRMGRVLVLVVVRMVCVRGVRVHVRAVCLRGVRVLWCACGVECERNTRGVNVIVLFMSLVTYLRACVGLDYARACVCVCVRVWCVWCVWCVYVRSCVCVWS
jgi:hypothetical protein